MPQVGAFFATAILGPGASATAIGIVGGIVNTLIGAAINLAVAKANQPKGPRPSEITTEVRGSSSKRIRHLGRVRASGTVAFAEWARVTDSGGFQRRFYKLLLVADGGMSNVIQWYLDGQPVSVDSSGYVTTEPWSKGNIRLRWRSGIQASGQWDGGQYADMISAFPGYWTTDHKCRGIGTICATFDAVEGEDISEVYSGGEPEVSALIDGAEALWVSDDYANTRNPARQLYDVLCNPIYGALSQDDMNDGSFGTARTNCLDAVPTDGGTRERYQSGISFALSDPMKDTAQKLLDAMGGRAWIDLDGRLSVEAGVWTAPTVTIEERHIHEMEYGAGTERISRVTNLIPSYVAPQVRWQETTADEWEDADAIALWGEGEPKSLDLLAVQHHGQARHLCKQQIAQMNPRRKMTLTLGAFGLRLLGERRVAIHIPRIGLSNVPFWINSWSFDGQNVTVNVTEADPSSYNWTAGEEGDPPADAEDYDRDNPTFSTTIDSLVVVTDDGPPYIRVAGTYAAEWGYVGMMQYRRTGASEWTDGIRETSGANAYRFRSNPLEDGGTYQVRTYVAPGGQTWKQASTPVVVSDIDVVANSTAPDAPVVVSESGAAGGTLTVTFVPDLGVNYSNTRLYRSAAGGVFADAVQDGNANYATSSDVTMTRAIPGGGAKYWLRSFNSSGVASATTLVGNYP
ncbi:hypothetical protein [Paracoccus litorisediminis]|uniref:Tip attachment protein J domain-containing protein n=1 Tax=Paracoccus litorisediminis TaxID=2006130 RepID=A0A844HLC5_9RHOB|nr:hypothetical protein [Paracoccus litorisediminis]MTH58995.1 hypothetical protein [Paracoccus litorisediminis]